MVRQSKLECLCIGKYLKPKPQMSNVQCSLPKLTFLSCDENRPGAYVIKLLLSVIYEFS